MRFEVADEASQQGRLQRQSVFKNLIFKTERSLGWFGFFAIKPPKGQFSYFHLIACRLKLTLLGWIVNVQCLNIKKDRRRHSDVVLSA